MCRKIYNSRLEPQPRSLQISISVDKTDGAVRWKNRSEGALQCSRALLIIFYEAEFVLHHKFRAFLSLSKQKNEIVQNLQCGGHVTHNAARLRVHRSWLWVSEMERTHCSAPGIPNSFGHWCTDQFETRSLLVVKFSIPGPKPCSNAPRQGWIQWPSASSRAVFPRKSDIIKVEIGSSVFLSFSVLYWDNKFSTTPTPLVLWANAPPQECCSRSNSCLLGCGESQMPLAGGWVQVSDGSVHKYGKRENWEEFMVNITGKKDAPGSPFSLSLSFHRSNSNLRYSICYICFAG